jgi:transposase
MVANSEETPESVESKFAAVVLADPVVLRLDDITLVDDLVILTVTSAQVEARCPACGQPSAHVHSSYVRHPSDLAVAGHRVQLRLNVRRFFCGNANCERKTYAERLPSVIRPFARRTQRLAETLCSLGQALGGEAGARRAEQLATPVSPDTMLRLVCQSDLPASATPTILGVDDWAWKKGHTYGTILVDLERQQVVDLLPERSADSLAEWLKQHPGVKIISRDRGGIYAEGARRGAPDAEQVADRFHLLKNLREALEPLLSREHAHLPKVAVSASKLPDTIPPAQPVQVAAESGVSLSRVGADTAVAQAGHITSEVITPATSAETPQTEPRTRLEQIQHDRRQRRQARYQDVMELRQQGMSLRGIAQQMGVGRHTVRRYVAADGFPEIAQRRPMHSLLDRFESYLRQRWDSGCHNATQLYREIQAQGYTGSRPLVSRWTARLRKDLLKPNPPNPAGTTRIAPEGQSRPSETRRKLSPSQAAWLLVCKPDDLKAEQKTALEQMCHASSEIAAAYDLVQGFARMVREHKADALGGWLETAKNSCLNELCGFANGIQRDLAAVMAGLSLPWSQGQVEGQVNRLKLVKRSMYGRAKFDLLKHRVLAPA